MSHASEHASLLHSVQSYSRFLENVSPEEFEISPFEGVWSYSEVYSHIFQSNLVSLTAAEKCISGIGEQTSGRIHWLAGIILFFGRFPPGKLKAPARIAAMVKKISKEDARNLIQKFESRLQDLVPKIHDARLNQKVKHPRLGLLNAPQWFRFVEIHTLHHEKQLQRISKMLKVK